jgi:hypothetical protein
LVEFSETTIFFYAQINSIIYQLIVFEEEDAELYELKGIIICNSTNNVDSSAVIYYQDANSILFIPNDLTKNIHPSTIQQYIHNIIIFR